MIEHTTHEIIVIGSGFGGAVAACRLAQAGFDVTVLERGRRYAESDFPNLPLGKDFVPEERRWSWTVDQGLWEVLDLDEVVSVQAAGFGGGSLVYANVHLRPPRSVFERGWPEIYKDRVQLDEYFDLAASMLEVAPITEHPFHAEITKGSQLVAAGTKVGARAFYPPLTIRSDEDGPNQNGIPQRRCTGCGACCTGCPQRSKNTLDLNYLAIAERHGARVFTQFEVQGLVERADGTWCVEALDHLEARKKKLIASHVFLCAGSVHSTQIMKRAQLRRDVLSDGSTRRRSVQRRVGLGYFPGGDAIGIVYDTEHPQRPSVGPVISTALVQWSDPKSFFMLQDGGYPAAVSKHVGVLQASALLDRNRVWQKQGRAEVPPAPEPPLQPQLGKPIEPFPCTLRGSFVEQLLDARAGGSLEAAVPAQLRDVKADAALKLSSPLLLTEVVYQAIVRSLRHRFRWIGWPRGVIAYLGWVVSRIALGPAGLVGVRGLRALFSGGDLNRYQIVARIAAVEELNAAHRCVLLAMGRDAAAGVLHYDRKHRRMVADLDLSRLAPGYSRQEGLMKRIARALGGELRNNPAWEFLHKPITVHNQGGCRMSDDPNEGVTDAFGRVHGCKGLYILDGSMLSGSVGVNPSATIAALAERGVLEFIRAHRSSFPDETVGGREYAAQQARARAWREKATARGWDLEPPTAPVVPDDVAVGITFNEALNGYFSQTDVQPSGQADYARLETLGRPHNPVELALTVRAPDLKAFIADPKHKLDLSGTVRIQLPGAELQVCNITTGELDLFVPVPKTHAWNQHDERIDVQQTITGVPYASVPSDAPHVRERLMTYTLSFNDGQGRNWVLRGYKLIAATSSFDAWRQTSTLFIRLCDGADAQHTRGAGAVHVDLATFLYKQFPGVQATGTDDPNRQKWAVAEFAAFFFGTLQRIYLPALRNAAQHANTPRRHEHLDS